MIGSNDLPGKVLHGTAASAAAGAIEAGRPMTLEQLETEHIRLILERSPTLEDAARILGIDPSTLYRKRKQMGL